MDVLSEKGTLQTHRIHAMVTELFENGRDIGSNRWSYLRIDHRTAEYGVRYVSQTTSEGGCGKVMLQFLMIDHHRLTRIYSSTDRLELSICRRIPVCFIRND